MISAHAQTHTRDPYHHTYKSSSLSLSSLKKNATVTTRERPSTTLSICPPLVTCHRVFLNILKLILFNLLVEVWLSNDSINEITDEEDDVHARKFNFFSNFFCSLNNFFTSLIIKCYLHYNN